VRGFNKKGNDAYDDANVGDVADGEGNGAVSVAAASCAGEGTILFT